MTYDYPGRYKMTITFFDSYGKAIREDDGYIKEEIFYDLFVSKKSGLLDFFPVESRKYLNDIEILIEDVDNILINVKTLLYREEEKYVFDMSFEL